MQPKADLKDLGILFIPDYDLGLNSYFIKRAYGNFLIFTHPKITQLNNYIENSGGLYKVFEYHNVFKNELSFLFNTYGSSLVTINKDFIFDKSFKQELWPDEYFDIDMTFIEEINAVQLKFKKKNIIFVDNFLEDFSVDESLYDHVLYRRIKDKPTEN